MKKTVFLFVLVFAVLTGSNALATVSGVCSNCHTMHNSQDGAGFDTTLSGAEIADVNRSLTKGDCVGCHTGTVANSATDGIPYVMSGAATGYGPDYNPGSGALINASTTNSLAGGTFNYVGTGAIDNTGHNVVDVSSEDATIGKIPPGWIATTFVNASAGNAVGDNWGSQQLTCAGTNGCHGDHAVADDFADIRGAHHGDDTTIDGSSVAKSYRFLRGILGYEDDDWELTVDFDDHNTYYGVDRANTTTASMDKQTISYLCAQCHGLFHSNDGSTADSGIIYSSTTIDDANPWLRHPTDFSLKSTAALSEYRSYADAAGTLATTSGVTAAYNYVAPLASATPTSAITDPFSGTDNDIVTCLSCHRAHGSAYADLLRWDYTKMTAGVATGFDNKGCFACHTSKD